MLTRSYIRRKRFEARVILAAVGEVLDGAGSKRPQMSAPELAAMGIGIRQ